MLKFDNVAFPFSREEIAEAGTNLAANKVVTEMNNQLSNFLERDLMQFGFSKKGPVKASPGKTPGINTSPTIKGA